jgi:hypothetical protein
MPLVGLKMPKRASLNHAGVGRRSTDSQVGAYGCAPASTAALVRTPDRIKARIGSRSIRCVRIVEAKAKLAARGYRTFAVHSPWHALGVGWEDIQWIAVEAGC